MAAIGDSPNDLALLQSAGLAGAVANAHPTVLAASDIIVPSNQDEGVARFLLHHVLHHGFDAVSGLLIACYSKYIPCCCEDAIGTPSAYVYNR